jgi:ATP-dependent Lhr-like helicase
MLAKFLAGQAGVRAHHNGGTDFFAQTLAEVTEAVPARGDRDRPRRPRDGAKPRHNRFIRSAPKGLTGKP